MSCMCRHRRLAERDLGDGTIMSRVDTLEHAVAALTRVQVHRCCASTFNLSSNPVREQNGGQGS